MKKIFIVALLVVVALSCSDNTSTTPMLTDNFDRGELLAFWADEIIVPAYTAYGIELDNFRTASTDFFSDPNLATLNDFRSGWLESYLAWQEVSMFEIGKAEQIGLRNFTNIYPTDTDLIHSYIENQNFNLELPSSFVAQGFPALDYLLYGIENSDDSIVSTLANEAVKDYVLILVDRMIELNSLVLEDWDQNFKVDFIANKGSSATAATDKMVNDFLFFYERYLRAAKIGIPAGIFTGTENVALVEAPYSNIYSKQLFEKAFSVIQDFFIGRSFDGQSQGLSLKQYLDEIHLSNNTELDYSEAILSQWEAVEKAKADVSDSFTEQIEENNFALLALYDELQKAVVLLKVDMMQALNIQVDFVDSDGD